MNQRNKSNDKIDEEEEDALEKQSFKFMPRDESSSSMFRGLGDAKEDDDIEKEEYDYEYDDEEYGAEVVSPGKSKNKPYEDDDDYKMKNTLQQNNSKKLGNKLKVNNKANVMPNVDVKPNKMNNQFFNDDASQHKPIVEIDENFGEEDQS